MKKYLFILLTFISTIGFGQTDTTNTIMSSLVETTDSVSYEFPKYYIVDNDTVGLTITIEQAQKIDNDYELLKLYEDLAISYQEGDTIYLQVIGQLEEQVSVLKIEVAALKDVGSDKDVTIMKLKQEIDLYKDNEDKFERELANKDLIIGEKDEQIRKHKMQKLWGGIGGGVIIAGLVVTIITIAK